MNIKPGRELDALVASKVMDLEIGKTNFLIIGTRPKGSNLGYSTNGIKPYSTDIAAAWEVLEKVFPKEVCVFKSYDSWFVAKSSQSRFPDGTIDYIASGDTAPHAICLAALKACGVEV